MKNATRMTEVIATRDSDGALYIYDGRHKVCRMFNMSMCEPFCKPPMSWMSIDGSSIASGDTAKAILGGTYCGIRKGCMKRFSVVPVVVKPDTMTAKRNEMETL